MPRASRSVDPSTELALIIDSLRRSVRIKNHAVGTEETYVHWSARFIRFCFQALGQHPADAGPPAITAYLDYLALETATPQQTLHFLLGSSSMAA